MNYDLLTTVIFVVLLVLFLYWKRKNLDYQKMLFPLVYGYLYRTKWGIKLMQKTADKYKNLIILLGYIFTGVAWVGFFWASIVVLTTMIKFLMAPLESEAGVALLLPSTNVPGIGYLSFWYWIICIFILAIIHEFSHGIVAKAHDVKIKSSGFAFFAILLPLFPAAFVEPDEKKMAKKSDIVQYSVLAAGPLSNLILAFIIAMVFPFVTSAQGQALGPWENSISEPIGFSVDTAGDELPAAQSGITDGTIINSYNGATVNDSQTVIEQLYFCVLPGDTIELGGDKGKYSLTTTVHPDDNSKAYIGITNIINERRIKPGYEVTGSIYYWFKGLFRWLFLLNIFIGLANLLPFFITDGARMLLIATQKLFKDQNKAKKIWSGINTIFVVLLLLGFAITYAKKFGIL